MGFLWILIPLAAIAAGAFSEWLKFKKQTSELGSSTAELEGQVTKLKTELAEFAEERKALVGRIQNLEAIVTSEAWDTLGTDRQLAEAKAPLLEIPESGHEVAAQRSAQMARRLRNR